MASCRSWPPLPRHLSERLSLRHVQRGGSGAASTAAAKLGL
jgi:hypothetical protein